MQGGFCLFAEGSSARIAVGLVLLTQAVRGDWKVKLVDGAPAWMDRLRRRLAWSEDRRASGSVLLPWASALGVRPRLASASSRPLETKKYMEQPIERAIVFAGAAVVVVHGLFAMITQEYSIRKFGILHVGTAAIVAGLVEIVLVVGLSTYVLCKKRGGYGKEDRRD